MADRRDYYFRQKVTEAELDDGFDGLEQADRDFSADHQLYGIVTGLGVSEKSGTPDLSVDVAGGTAYTPQGERCQFGTTQNVDVSVDDVAASTAVAGGGNERWVSVFLEFDRALSDPRIDGNSATVFFVRDESFAFSIVQGAEAPIGTATRPALDPNKILLADVNRTFGQTQIFNADIDVSRRQDYVRLEGGTIEVVVGNAVDAVEALLNALNDHLDGAANKHPAADVTYAGGGNWNDGTTNPATSVELQLDKIISELADDSGLGNGGADRIGSAAQAGSPTSLSDGSIWDQLGTLLAAVNARVLKAGDTMTGTLTLNGAGVNLAMTGGDIILDGHIDFDPTPEDPGTGSPGANRIYAKNSVAAWVEFTTDGVGGLTIQGRYNVNTVVLDGGAPDRVDINLHVAMKSASNLAVQVTNSGGTAHIAAEVIGTRTASHFELILYDTTTGSQIGFQNNAEAFCVVIFGEQA